MTYPSWEDDKYTNGRISELEEVIIGLEKRITSLEAALMGFARADFLAREDPEKVDVFLIGNPNG